IPLFATLVTLYLLGPDLERLLGGWKFLMLFCLTGMIGNCALLADNPGGAIVGPLGATWGLLGAYAAWLYLRQGHLGPTLAAMLQRRLLIAFLLNAFLTYCLPNVSKAAQLAGGVIGLAL